MDSAWRWSAARAAAHAPPVIEVQAGGDGRAVELNNFAVNLPTGVPLVTSDNVKMPRGEPVLVTGPSGSGKSTLFRAIAGIWPFGSGRVVVPKDARLMMLPQRPYFPVGSLAAAVTYPAEAGSYDREQIAEAINAVGLPALAQRLDEEAHWNRMLSLGEQQRLGIARALLQKPDFLFLDEATASLDEPCGGGALPAAPGAAAGCDRRFDRPPLDARGVPSPAARARARRRRLSPARGGAEAGLGITTSAAASDHVGQPQCNSQAGRNSRHKRNGRQPLGYRPRQDGPWSNLLEVGVDRQVGREAGDEAAAAPVRRHYRSD